MLQTADWPPPYKIKRHPRAKHVRLRASPLRGIEITIPMRFNLQNISAVLERNKAWVLKQLAKLPDIPSDNDNLPLQLTLFGQQWQIQYATSDARLTLYARPDLVLVVVGKIDDKAACQKKLLLWVKAQAKTLLLCHLIKISLETKLPFSDAQVRAQQTLWGSCTRHNAISLNFRLVFFPPAVIRYVIIHELSHTIHHNHSEKFWALVARLDPEYMQHRKELKKAAQFIPAWMI